MLEVIHRRAGNAVGLLEGRALIFLRDRPLTEEALEAVANTVHRTTLTRPAGALAIIPGDAGLSSERLITRQRKIFQEAKRLDDVWLSFCVQGDGVQAIAMRAVVRMFVLGQPRSTLHAKPETAIVWFAGRLGLSVETVRAAVAALRGDQGMPQSRR